MGRTYDGDIDGCFFSFQGSDDAVQFGGEVVEPMYTQHQFRKEHLDSVAKRIHEITQYLMNEDCLTEEDKKKVADALTNKDTDTAIEMINDVIDLVLDDESKTKLASLSLGIEIRDCIVKKGKCHFDAYYC